MSKGRKLQAEFQEILLRGAETLLEELNKADTKLNGEHIHAFCLERAANLAQIFVERTADDQDAPQRSVARV